MTWIFNFWGQIISLVSIFKKRFLEKAHIWTEWGECHTTTCTQRRVRKCKDESKCKGSADDDRDNHLSWTNEEGETEYHADYVQAGWEKFDRHCTDKTECFTPVTDSMPKDGEFINRRITISLHFGIILIDLVI